ncbi:hypothetical protein ACVWYO_002201 [Sphingomonas sp. UYP23]
MPRSGFVHWSFPAFGVIPAKVGIHKGDDLSSWPAWRQWIPAFAGMTAWGAAIPTARSNQFCDRLPAGSRNAVLHPGCHGIPVTLFEIVSLQARGSAQNRKRSPLCHRVLGSIESSIRPGPRHPQRQPGAMSVRGRSRRSMTTILPLAGKDRRKTIGDRCQLRVATKPTGLHPGCAAQRRRPPPGTFTRPTSRTPLHSPRGRPRSAASPVRSSGRASCGP